MLNIKTSNLSLYENIPYKERFIRNSQELVFIDEKTTTALNFLEIEL